jgi:hypothetical protein
VSLAGSFYLFDVDVVHVWSIFLSRGVYMRMINGLRIKRPCYLSSLATRDIRTGQRQAPFPYPNICRETTLEIPPDVAQGIYFKKVF